MRVRSSVAVIAILFSVGIAGASPKTDIQTKIKEAMENYDLMDYDAARKGLTQALAIAKKAKLEKDPIVAKAHLSLGIVQFVNNDADGAKLSFLSAVQIDPKIQIDAAYKSNEMSKLLEQVRKEASGGGGGGAVEPDPIATPAAPSGPDCTSVQGVQHDIIDTAKGGAPLKIEAFLGADVTSTKVSVLYRVEGATEFSEVKLAKEGDCKYTGSIPASAMKGSLVHYYVAAYNDGPKAVASKGSSGSPNIIEISGMAASSGGGGDNEDPIAGGGGGGGGGSVSSGVTVGPKRARFLLAVAGGGGTGYVSGETEGMNTVKDCCFGGPIVVLQPEIGYYVNPRLSIGLAGRIGLPLGANVEGHATAAPGVLARVRYALSANGEGLRFMGQLGAGILRNTIKIDDTDPSMDTDIVAQGPLLVGAGVGFTRRLSGVVSVMADLSALGAIAVTDSLGAAPVLNNGFGIDLSLGIQLGF
jgi:hypothetical protein